MPLPNVSRFLQTVHLAFAQRPAALGTHLQKRSQPASIGRHELLHQVPNLRGDQPVLNRLLQQSE